MSVFESSRLKELAKNWLQEFYRTNSFNYSFFVGEDHESEFDIVMKTPGILAGIIFVDAIISHIEATIIWYHTDGYRVTNVTTVGKVTGSKRKLLAAERVILNTLSRASGVATNASKIHENLKDFKWKGILAGTSNTTPGFSLLENYALLLGGDNMRAYDLTNTVLLREIHISAAGSVEKAIERVRQMRAGITYRIQVECKTFLEAFRAAKSGCDIVKFSNIRSLDVIRHSTNLKYKYPNLLVEASGDIKPEDLRKYASSFVDFISTKSFFEGYPTIDFLMQLRTETITING